MPHYLPHQEVKPVISQKVIQRGQFCSVEPGETFPVPNALFPVAKESVSATVATAEVWEGLPVVDQRSEPEQRPLVSPPPLLLSGLLVAEMSQKMSLRCAAFK